MVRFKVIFTKFHLQYYSTTHTLHHFHISCFTYHTHNPTFPYYVSNVLVFELLVSICNLICPTSNFSIS